VKGFRRHSCAGGQGIQAVFVVELTKNLDARVREHDGAIPLLQRTPFGVRRDLSFPEFATEQEPAVGANQAFTFAFR